eukprot:NODE_2278_length_806_cov_679.114927_g1497_i3.p1 GENE.NODE_2278_length_806_cov_679.114927_g1497_i3~~NODE_2278_length_806_cov_679.114927_g1497_i3.p1  ORF type:complete len:198 (+),score=11.31 NODE_2278_length_806_cov_679.114927_g1497_i3:99-692(+)
MRRVPSFLHFKRKLPVANFKSELPSDPYFKLFWNLKKKQSFGAADLPKEAGAELKLKGPVCPGRPASSIGDLCNQLVQGTAARRRFIVCHYRPRLAEIASILLDEGLIRGFREFVDTKTLIVELKYHQDRGVIQYAESVSGPTRKVYWDRNQLLQNVGILNEYSPTVYIIAHPEHPLMTAHEAYRLNITGEVLMRVW